MSVVSDTHPRKKTVIFGPFIGEFGWETMHWMGWVNSVSQTTFKDFQKVVISYPGRGVLYPYADKFVALPNWFIDSDQSARNYILDGWVDGYPGKLHLDEYKIDLEFALRKILKLEKPHRIPKETPFLWSSAKVLAQSVLNELAMDFLSENPVIICPWRLNDFNGDVFGFDDKGPVRFLSQENKIRRFPNPIGDWSRLKSTNQGRKLVSGLTKGSQRLIMIFPRKRLHRREDKNWGQENYLELIGKINSIFPDHTICIAGEPNGAYFADAVPKTCVDLINIDPQHRLDSQVAALEISELAVGSLSGAMFLPLMTGTSTLVFGLESEKKRFERDNILNTKLNYFVATNPSVSDIFSEMETLLAH
jgi:hypothetical protein